MIRLMQGDCLELMAQIPDGSVDCVVADPPYGTTDFRWDKTVPLGPMWAGLKRVVRDRGAVVLFGTEPFSSALRTSNPEWFKYDWIWVKNNPAGFMNAKNRPMNAHEAISVFSSGTASPGNRRNMTYNPQGLVPYNKVVRGRKKNGNFRFLRPSMPGERLQEWTNYPTTVLHFPKVKKALHPTQKPVALLEYLIRTYTNPGGVVLDPFMGSGTTGVACVRTGRNFIGIELDAHYFEVAKERIAAAQREMEG